MKIPAGDAREEFEVECACIEDAIALLCEQGAPKELAELAQKGLLPICGAEFERLAGINDLDGAIVEVSLDKGFLFAGDRTEPLFEMEVELKWGDPDRMDEIVRLWMDLFKSQPIEDSKFKRARALMQEGTV